VYHHVLKTISAVSKVNMPDAVIEAQSGSLVALTEYLHIFAMCGGGSMSGAARVSQRDRPWLA
jgi:hypothetical protein